MRQSGGHVPYPWMTISENQGFGFNCERTSINVWSLIASYVSVWSERNRACGVRAYVNFSPFRNGSVWLNSVFHWQKCPTLHEEQLNHVVLIRVWLFFPICRNRIDIKRPRCVSILMGLTKGFVSVSLEPACPGFHSLHLVYLDGSGSSTRNVNCHTYHVQTHVIFIFFIIIFSWGTQKDSSLCVPREKVMRVWNNMGV